MKIKDTKMKRLLKTSLVIFGILFSAVLAFSAAACLKQFTFDDPNPLSRWDKMILNGQVDYAVLKEGDNGFLNALSEKTCSALYYRMAFKLKDYPMISWKWRVIRFPDKSRATTDKERDDYAARVYVIFPFLNFSSSKFMEYVWDANLPLGTIISSPEGDNIKMIVARSGVDDSGEWKCENRNVYEDYMKAFGVEWYLSHELGSKVGSFWSWTDEAHIIL